MDEDPSVSIDNVSLCNVDGLIATMCQSLISNVK